MEDPDWVPKTYYDVYNSDQFKSQDKINLERNSKI